MNEEATYAFLILRELARRGDFVEKRDNLTEPVTACEKCIYGYLSCCSKQTLKQCLKQLEKLPDNTNIYRVLVRLGLLVCELKQFH